MGGRGRGVLGRGVLGGGVLGEMGLRGGGGGGPRMEPAKFEQWFWVAPDRT